VIGVLVPAPTKVFPELRLFVKRDRVPMRGEERNKGTTVSKSSLVSNKRLDRPWFQCGEKGRNKRPRPRVLSAGFQSASLATWRCRPSERAWFPFVLTEIEDLSRATVVRLVALSL